MGAAARRVAVKTARNISYLGFDSNCGAEVYDNRRRDKTTYHIPLFFSPKMKPEKARRYGKEKAKTEKQIVRDMRWNEQEENRSVAIQEDKAENEYEEWFFWCMIEQTVDRRQSARVKVMMRAWRRGQQQRKTRGGGWRVCNPQC